MSIIIDSLEKITKHVAIKGQIKRLARIGKTPSEICTIMDCLQSYDIIVEYLQSINFVYTEDDEPESYKLSTQDKRVIRKKFNDHKRVGHEINTKLLSKNLNKPEIVITRHLKEIGYTPKRDRRKKATLEEVKQILQWHKEGKGYHEIADKLDISFRAVIAYIDHDKKNHWSKEQFDYLKEKAEESIKTKKSLNFNTIGKHLGKCSRTVKRKVVKEDLNYFSPRKDYYGTELKNLQRLAKISKNERVLTCNCPEVIEHAMKFQRTTKGVIQRIRKENKKL